MLGQAASQSSALCHGQSDRRGASRPELVQQDFTAANVVARVREILLTAMCALA